MIISVILSRMRYRTSYDTSIKHLYRKGLEEAIPLSLRKKIPRNTIHRWRNETEDKYTGCELNDLAQSELAMLKEFVRFTSESVLLITIFFIAPLPLETFNSLPVNAFLSNSIGV
jgi:hypothetical protein